MQLSNPCQVNKQPVIDAITIRCKHIRHIDPVVVYPYQQCINSDTG